MAEGHVVKIEMKVNGSHSVSGDNGEVSFKDGSHIERMRVDQRLDSPDYFTADITLMNVDGFMALDALKPGDEIELLMGYQGGAEATVFSGEISYIEPSFSPVYQIMRVSGYDVTHRLTRGTNSRTWGEGHEVDQDAGDIASEVIADAKERKGETSHGLSGSTDAASVKVEWVGQFGTNNYQFIRSLGQGISMSMDSQCAEGSSGLDFVAVDVTASPKVTICFDKPDPADAVLVMSADFSLSTVKQVGKVEVRGWNVKEKKAILGTAESCSQPFDGTSGPNMAGEAHWGSGSAGPVVSVMDETVVDDAEAEALAQSIFDSLAMEYVTGTVAVKGQPELRAGDVVELKGFGSRFSGKYLVQGAEHAYAADGSSPYTTTLSVVRDACPDP